MKFEDCNLILNGEAKYQVSSIVNQLENINTALVKNTINPTQTYGITDGEKWDNDYEISKYIAYSLGLLDAALEESNNFGNYVNVNNGNAVPLEFFINAKMDSMTTKHASSRNSNKTLEGLYNAGKGVKFETGFGINNLENMKETVMGMVKYSWNK